MKRKVLVALALTVAAGHAQAAAYTAEYVFGDSLSDRGNLAETGFLQTAYGVPVTTNYPNPPSNHDSFTNGPVAVQLLAKSFGLNADPSVFVTAFKDVNGLFGGASYVPGTNYAVAGATAALTPPVAGGVPGANLPNQIAAYTAFVGGKADANALYVVFIGGNDVRNAALNATGVTLGVTAEVNAIQTLVTEGARKFLVVNVPDVGAIPEFQKGHPTLAANATLYSQNYNTQLAAGEAGLVLPLGTSVTNFDLYSYANQINTDVKAGLLTIKNTTDYCYTATPILTTTTAACGANAQNINSLYFWDAIHPTAEVQAIWASGFAQALNGQTPLVPLDVPAPGGTAVIVAAMLGLFARIRAKAA